jgi:uncharacterized protein (TIGR02246 family)
MNADEQAVKALLHAFSDAFNAHDEKQLASLFAGDADFVNIFGHWMKGRAAIEAGHAGGFAGALGNSHLAITGTQVKLLKPDVALCHATWKRSRISGAHDHGLSPGDGVLTAVAVQHNDKWVIVAVHNSQTVAPPGKP